MPWTIIQKIEWCTLQDKVIESMLPNPHTPTPAERPPPPLLIGMPLSPENVCSQFNLLAQFVAQGIQTTTFAMGARCR
jgi:hypothetical protein